MLIWLAIFPAVAILWLAFCDRAIPSRYWRDEITPSHERAER